MVVSTYWGRIVLQYANDTRRMPPSTARPLRRCHAGAELSEILRLIAIEELLLPFVSFVGVTVLSSANWDGHNDWLMSNGATTTDDGSFAYHWFISFVALLPIHRPLSLVEKLARLSEENLQEYINLSPNYLIPLQKAIISSNEWSSRRYDSLWWDNNLFKGLLAELRVEWLYLWSFCIRGARSFTDPRREPRILSILVQHETVSFSLKTKCIAFSGGRTINKSVIPMCELWRQSVC